MAAHTRFKMPEGEPIAQFAGWRLYLQDAASASEWKALRLIKHPLPQNHRHKHSFRLGWNGVRLSANRDLAILTEHEVELRDELVEWLTEHNDELF
jgi:hypothetical protein